MDFKSTLGFLNVFCRPMITEVIDTDTGENDVPYDMTARCSSPSRSRHDPDRLYMSQAEVNIRWTNSHIDVSVRRSGPWVGRSRGPNHVGGFLHYGTSLTGCRGRDAGSATRASVV